MTLQGSHLTPSREGSEEKKRKRGENGKRKMKRDGRTGFSLERGEGKRREGKRHLKFKLKVIVLFSPTVMFVI